ncbi:uncharacterized protein TrAtP1_012491 [Trichoderma atroviride]|uniref:uncharacterized protein n=1 Tax=Hypocrea atroviridis TaxID=63577 RepID=UPI00331D477F|nr:hypothetical protein TrAtP1_012491 [Trichoderma atroviride]
MRSLTRICCEVSVFRVSDKSLDLGQPISQRRLCFTSELPPPTCSIHACRSTTHDPASW